METVMTDTRNYLDPAYGPVVPMIPKARLDQMLDLAVKQPQHKSTPFFLKRHPMIWSGGLATAACLILVVAFTLLGYEPPDNRDSFDDPSMEVSELILAEAMDDF